MFFPLGDEWWVCQERDCSELDRASVYETRMWVHWVLQDLRTDRGKMWLLQDLVRHNISGVPFHLPHDVFVRRVEQLFNTGQLHVHKKRREVQSGSGADESNVAFPLADHRPRIASKPAPMLDAPVFAPHVNMAAQAAALMAAASNGAPFCQE